jgi:hypothetical protein
MQIIMLVFGLNFSMSFFQMSFCQMSFCQMSFCQMSFCQMSFCQMLFCQMTFCQMTFCQMSFYQMPFCQMSFCQMPFCYMLFCQVMNVYLVLLGLDLRLLAGDGDGCDVSWSDDDEPLLRRPSNDADADRSRTDDVDSSMERHDSRRSRSSSPLSIKNPSFSVKNF